MQNDNTDFKNEMRSLVFDVVSLTFKAGAISATPFYTGEELDAARTKALDSVIALIRKIDNL